jgi:hypothetical protein
MMKVAKEIYCNPLIGTKPQQRSGRVHYKQRHPDCYETAPFI